jgi:hypothetical protein
LGKDNKAKEEKNWNWGSKPPTLKGPVNKYSMRARFPGKTQNSKIRVKKRGKV